MALLCSPSEISKQDPFVNLMKSIKKSFFVGGIDLANTVLLGKGAFGNVYLGRDTTTEEGYAAVKTMDFEKHEKFIRNELAIMLRACQSGHANIVQFLEYSKKSQFAFISTEYCSGGCLYDFVHQDRDLLVDEIKTISLQMAQALVFLSDINIVHCDIKLDNILLSSAISDSEHNYLWNHTLKLCDFGLGQYCESDKFLKEQRGTPGYMAPEMLQYIPYGKSADIFSVGVVLYVCATKTMPFDLKGDRFDLLERISNGPSLVKLMNVKFVDLISNLLHIIPEKRLTAAEFLNHNFNKLQE